jgi:hypothetical protein
VAEQIRPSRATSYSFLFIGARTDRLEYTSSPKCSRLDPILSGVHGLLPRSHRLARVASLACDALVERPPRPERAGPRGSSDLEQSLQASEAPAGWRATHPGVRPRSTEQPSGDAACGLAAQAQGRPRHQEQRRPR